jgi:hypothetical protein
MPFLRQLPEIVNDRYRVEWLLGSIQRLPEANSLLGIERSVNNGVNLPLTPRLASDNLPNPSMWI